MADEPCGNQEFRRAYDADGGTSYEIEEAPPKDASHGMTGLLRYGFGEVEGAGDGAGVPPPSGWYVGPVTGALGFVPPLALP